MTRRQRIAASVAGLGLAVIAGFGLGRFAGSPSTPTGAPSPESERKVLYWYDPMKPAQHFDKPGKSPFMDMELQPKYADEAGEAGGGVQIDPARTQNLGARLATVERGSLSAGVIATGVIDFNGRDVAIVQARAAGYVQRVYGRAPGDVIAAGAPLADLLVPEWAGAQGEFLALRKTGDAALIAAARQRLQLLGMPATLVAAVERSGKVRNVVTVTTPISGAITTLSVRTGMTVAAGQPLAEVNGLSQVWLNAAVPEAQIGQVRLGEAATATLAAFPGEVFSGRVTALLPQADVASRTLTVRIELPNPRARLRPGMFATVQLGGAATPALLIPSEALIRTGKRTLVMVAQAGGKYLPAEVRIGREADGRAEVLSGLSEGEKVVASGQFLIDSEASLSGVQARPASKTGPSARTAPALHDGVGRIEKISPGSVTLSHGPIPSISWPAMTMAFALGSPDLAQGLKAGDQVRFRFEETPKGPVVRQITRAPGQ